MLFDRELIILLALGAVGISAAPLAEAAPKVVAARADYGVSHIPIDDVSVLIRVVGVRSIRRLRFIPSRRYNYNDNFYSYTHSYRLRELR